MKKKSLIIIIAILFITIIIATLIVVFTSDELKIKARTSSGRYVAGNATTTGETVHGSNGAGANATTTFQFGNNGTIDTEGICFKFFSGGQEVFMYFDSTPEPVWTGTSCE